MLLSPSDANLLAHDSEYKTISRCSFSLFLALGGLVFITRLISSCGRKACSTDGLFD